MEPRGVCYGIVAHSGTKGWSRLGGSVGGGRIVRFGVLVAFLAGGRGVAQNPSEGGRLTVRPHEMATGTHTARAGHQPLDSIAGASVYVPAQCVGTRRCPLVVFLPLPVDTLGGVLDLQDTLADKYGMILLVARPAFVPSFMIESYLTGRTVSGETADIEAAMRRVLQTYAIDPDKIALAGYRGEEYTLAFGCENLDVFSRIATISAWGMGPRICPVVHPRNTQTRVYVSGGLGEIDFVGTALRLTRELRQEGYAVEKFLTLRGYAGRREDFDHLWWWLSESWAHPAVTTAPPPPVDPGSILTPRAVKQLTDFWTRFMQEPDSIRKTARSADQKQITISVVQERFSIMMTDMPALAAGHPSVAAALKAAGLTAQQADAYRIALITASANIQATRRYWRLIAPVIESPVSQNMAFMRAHKELLKALGSTGMWTTP